MSDLFNLQRFIAAQNPVYSTVCAELGAGAKVSHWMWFIFPQLKGLGQSATAKFFGLEGRAEALAYWQHPVLGPRLQECTYLILALTGLSAPEILGSVDAMKLRSCMTLFAQVAPEEPVFRQAIEKYFGGVPDEGPLQLLG
jgi:uncharacterized protein (DUF1810 family)